MEKPMPRRIARIARIAAFAVLALAVAIAALAASRSAQAAKHGGGKLTIVAYSTPGQAFGKLITTWDDIVKPGVKVVVPNPLTSGGARWDILAAYGAERRYGRTDKQAQSYLQTLFKSNVVSQDKSARDALNTFLSGKGDVLL